MSKREFTCKIVFGLGVTSSTDFVELAHRYKALKDAGVAYVNSLTTKYPNRAGVVVFEGVRELFRCYKYIRSHQVVVISEIPSLLKEVSEIIPLDFDNARSFEFNFKPVDIQYVLRAVRSKKLSMTSGYTSYDNLGYHINRVSSNDKFLTTYLALTSSLPFDRREGVRKGIVRFLNNKRANVAVVVAAVQDAVRGTSVGAEQVDPFVNLFTEYGTKYHEAINSNLAPAISAKRFEVDQYTLTYMKRLLRSHQVTTDRLARNDSKLETA